MEYTELHVVFARRSGTEELIIPLSGVQDVRFVDPDSTADNIIASVCPNGFEVKIASFAELTINPRATNVIYVRV